jgi:HD-GYP domain-containing protein (c-di-GMP phosphodiesterase class II)
MSHEWPPGTLEQLNEIGIALSTLQDTETMLERILLAAQQLVRADGGTLYLCEGDALHFKILRTNSLGLAFGGSAGNPVPFPPIPLHLPNGEPNDHLVVCNSVLNRCTVNIADVYEEAGFDFSGTRNFDRKTGYLSRSFLTVPMKNHEDRIIGVLQLINAIDQDALEIVPFTPANQRLVESLASQAAVVLTNRQLIDQMTALFEAMIALINIAIDDKSPYTGAHCQRVPELTMMIAEAANHMESGPLADFRMTDKDRYELMIAGLLHDCGKITTPVHVVDKATKLETISDRIHLVDTRFEVLKRDAEIAMLKGELSEEAYQERLRQLDDDREFLRRSNRGGEYMPPEQQQRVAEIGAYRWRGPDGEDQPFLDANELENLSISRGTLTEAERKIINHHIEVTIQMLESLPWPEHLKNVPEYAGGHHERMDGKGYPRGLTRDQMSVQARMMAIADIFEALTSTDRPYKSAKRISECLSIMGKMRDTGHIDPDLYEVFLEEKVYLTFARKFLAEEQIDVD